MFKQKINDFEKTALKILASLAAAFSPVAYYFAGPRGILSFLLGSILAVVSFTAIVWMAYLIIPADREKPVGTRDKVFVALSYILKISLFIAAFIMLSKSGIREVLSFVGGFSVLFPALMIAGYLKK